MTGEPVVAPLQAAEAATAWHSRCVTPWAHSLRPGEVTALLDLAMRRAQKDAANAAPSEASPE